MNSYKTEILPCLLRVSACMGLGDENSSLQRIEERDLQRSSSYSAYRDVPYYSSRDKQYFKNDQRYPFKNGGHANTLMFSVFNCDFQNGINMT